MRLPAWMRRRRFASGLAIAGLSLATLAMTKAAEQHNWLGTAEPSNEPAEQPAPEPPEPCPEPATPDPLLGPRTKKPGSWVGRSPVQSNLPIVVMAGHADSQGTASPGTPGFAVDQQK
ncbi:MAG: N-acetylmuramoyl-L-alanine amidase, partial [Cyanobacteria bacterium MAG COS4_bin_21]|nr:N-acetylmuramoyl-L-alanine amidase [Cyanobacteria bacterium MAG COS4_bin_21]